MGVKLKVLGITLARGGSKGIPKKNIKLISGKPLISHTIEHALKSGIFDNYIVSTDSNEIAEISKEYGAEIPFIRPDELSGDKIWSRDCVKHAVLECEKIYNVRYDYVVELPCVSPLRNSKHIKEAFDMLVNTGADSVTSVTQMQDKHPVRMKRIVRGRLSDFCKEFPEGEGSRRQDLEECYIRNGAIYAMTRDCIVENFSRHGNDCRAYVMDDTVSVNIDTMIDFKLAEVLLNEN
jgi:CMP-N-acetylneuraminic acid synthetase